MIRLSVGVVVFGIAASCGGTIPTKSDAGSDTGHDVLQPGCSSDADCHDGERCAYPINGGCHAQKECFAPQPLCNTGVYCACDGSTMFDDCGDGASKPVKSAGPCDACDTAPVSCEVCEIVGFAPSPLVRPESATHACFPDEITSFVTACVGAAATEAACANWKQNGASAACQACVLTTNASTSSGAFVCDPTACQPNRGGCIDITLGEVALEIGSGGTGSCGELVSYTDQCIAYTCGECVPQSTDAAKCATDAQGAECKPFEYAASSSPACANLDAGTNVCSPQSDAEWASFINLFCGTGP